MSSTPDPTEHKPLPQTVWPPSPAYEEVNQPRLPGGVHALQEIRRWFIYLNLLVALIDSVRCAVFGRFLVADYGSGQISIKGLFEINDALTVPHNILDGFAGTLLILWFFIAFQNIHRAGAGSERPLRSTILLNIPYVSLIYFIPLMTRLWTQSLTFSQRSNSGRLVGIATFIVLDWLICVASSLVAAFSPWIDVVFHGTQYAIAWATLNCCREGLYAVLDLMILLPVAKITDAQLDWDATDNPIGNIDR